MVFDAWDRVLDRRVAVKVLDALFTSANLRRRFLRRRARPPAWPTRAWSRC